MATAKKTRPDLWSETHGTYLTGRSYIDGAQALAIEMEKKWGADRLRLLVGQELREKFDRQRFLFNAAIWHGDLEAVRLQSERMVKAWRALDGAAEAAGASWLSPEVWETSLSDGTVVAVVPDRAAAHGVMAEGRRLVTYTLEELGRMIEVYQATTKVKEAFPGATVTQLRRQSIPDPLDAIRDAKDLDQPLDDMIPIFS